MLREDLTEDQLVLEGRGLSEGVGLERLVAVNSDATMSSYVVLSIGRSGSRIVSSVNWKSSPEIGVPSSHTASSRICVVDRHGAVIVDARRRRCRNGRELSVTSSGISSSVKPSISCVHPAQYD